MKRQAVLVVMALLMVGSVVGPAAMAGADSNPTAVCHKRGQDQFESLTVANPAVPAHMEHGDGQPGNPVPGRIGYVFDANCFPVFADTDGDGVPDATDNCILISNPDQLNQYGSTAGDACEDTGGDGVRDVDESDICIVINATTILRSGTQVGCSSSPSIGTRPNIAIAIGYLSFADAAFEEGNTAIAIGYRAFVRADGGGSGNTALATGDFSSAYISAAVTGTSRARPAPTAAPAPVTGIETRRTATAMEASLRRLRATTTSPPQPEPTARQRSGSDIGTPLRRLAHAPSGSASCRIERLLAPAPKELLKPVKSRGLTT